MGGRGGEGTFFALSASSLASMVMYLTPLTLMPSEMTFLGSDLSLKDLAMAALSSSDSCHLSACECTVRAQARAVPFRVLLQDQRLCPAQASRRRTVKSGEAAQLVAPSTSQMRALSMLPVPTRLEKVVRRAGGGRPR